MQISDADTAPLKTWLIKRLEYISDADSDVLADYVLALAKNDDPEKEVRALCIESLEDFLKDHTTKFVDDVFQALHQRSFVPGYKPPQPKPKPALTPSYPPHLSGAPPALFGQAGYQPEPQSRKRSHHDFEANGSVQRGGFAQGHERAPKHAKRGRGGRGGFVPRGASSGGLDQNMQHTPGPPYMQRPPGPVQSQPPIGYGGNQHLPAVLPDFDPNNPMASMAAFQQALGLPEIPGMSSYSGSQTPQSRSMVPPPINAYSPQEGFSTTPQRCRDYDINGVCNAGGNCPYQHTAPVYDPANPTLPPHLSAHQRRPYQYPRGDLAQRNGPATFRVPRQRSSQSLPGPNQDPNNTTIVVEKIPQEHMSQDAIRTYFEKFGPVEELNVEPSQQIAIIKYGDNASANRAYTSPEVIFNNRFVKVYWQKPQHIPRFNASAVTFNMPGKSQDKPEPGDEEMLDPEEVAQKAAEAQRQHEEKAKKLAEAASAKEDLDKRIKAQAEERKTLLARLATKVGNGSPAPDSAGKAPASAAEENGAASTNGTDTTKASSLQTEALRIKLAALEAEAETLGIQPDDASSYWQSPYQQAYPTPRGAFASRGATRGAYRRGAGMSRGGWSGAARGGAVARLDNRPKSVSVTIVGVGVEHEGLPANFEDDRASEALRTFLRDVGDYASMTSPTPTSPKTVTVAFRERYVAEKLIALAEQAGAAKGVKALMPSLGPVELSWVRELSVAGAGAAPLSKPQTTNGTTAGAEKQKLDNDVDMNGAADGDATASMEQLQQKKTAAGANGKKDDDREMDYDVADDDDRWS